MDPYPTPLTITVGQLDLLVVPSLRRAQRASLASQPHPPAAGLAQKSTALASTRCGDPGLRVIMHARAALRPLLPFHAEQIPFPCNPPVLPLT